MAVNSLIVLPLEGKMYVSSPLIWALGLSDE